MYELVKKKSPAVKIIGSVFLLFIITSLLKYIVNGTRGNVKAELIKTASDMNRHMPVFIDSTTRLDNISYVPDNLLQYNYSFTNHTKEEIDTAALSSAARKSVIELTKSNPKADYFRENKIDLSISYRDKNGEMIETIAVRHGEY